MGIKSFVGFRSGFNFCKQQIEFKNDVQKGLININNDPLGLFTYSLQIILYITTYFFLGFFDEVPRGLVNINYGPHGCVHMGTIMDPNLTTQPPTRIRKIIEEIRFISFFIHSYIYL